MPDHVEFKVIQFLHPEGPEPFERKLNAAAAEGFEFLGLAGVQGYRCAPEASGAGNPAVLLTPPPPTALPGCLSPGLTPPVGRVAQAAQPFKEMRAGAGVRSTPAYQARAAASSRTASTPTVDGARSSRTSATRA